MGSSRCPLLHSGRLNPLPWRRMSRHTPLLTGTVLRPASTPRLTGGPDWGVIPRLNVRGERPTVGSPGGTLGDRSSRHARLSAASATCKQARSPRSSGNHPSIWASSGHRFIRYCGGAWPIRGDSTTLGWDQGIAGCSPPTSSRFRHPRRSSVRSTGSVHLPVRRYLAGSLESSAARTPSRPSTSSGRWRRPCGRW